MAITDTLKKLVGKVLNLGTPPEKEVLYKEVIKRKAPKESAEMLVINDIKNSFKKVFSTEEDVEFSRGTRTPPIKEVAKKKAPAKKTTAKKPAVKKPATKKATVTKKTTTTKTTSDSKKPMSTKPAAKKPVSKKTTAKKASTSKEVTTTKKPTVKRPTTKTSITKKTTASTKSTETKKSPVKKPVAKKETVKKDSTTKTTVSTKKATIPAKKSAAAPRGAKKAEKIALYIKDIKKHYGEVDEDFVAIVVKNLGPSIYKKDAELVSCSDPKELDTVRKNFLIKKLGIDASQGVLDAAIQDVCEELKGVRRKYRATFYYSLAKKFKKESVLK